MYRRRAHMWPARSRKLLVCSHLISRERAVLWTREQLYSFVYVKVCTGVLCVYLQSYTLSETWAEAHTFFVYFFFSINKLFWCEELRNLFGLIKTIYYTVTSYCDTGSLAKFVERSYGKIKIIIRLKIYTKPWSLARFLYYVVFLDIAAFSSKRKIFILGCFLSSSETHFLW